MDETLAQLVRKVLRKARGDLRPQFRNLKKPDLANWVVPVYRKRNARRLLGNVELTTPYCQACAMKRMQHLEQEIGKENAEVVITAHKLERSEPVRCASCRELLFYHLTEDGLRSSAEYLSQEGAIFTMETWRDAYIAHQVFLACEKANDTLLEQMWPKVNELVWFVLGSHHTPEWVERMQNEVLFATIY